MDSKSFVVLDYYELIALQRVFREAKFCLKASDEDISASPIVAKLFERALDVLIDVEVGRKGPAAAEDWSKWKKIDPSREEWMVAHERATKERDWQLWSYSDKLEYVRVLFSPFEISEQLAEEFIISIGL
ncbi:hypothetical protein HUX88_03140 [Duganella sp. BJB1802]|uniref:hypothetical protein n=1 Tax=Duganella sp. BJB1802 TaxID=2744575 RepID=UPI0015937848|nr:hypothetical protein [Duganella sp. BJB1802]NVD69552.1 hypothetical protein [Duganella sp. BJB1802]